MFADVKPIWKNSAGATADSYTAVKSQSVVLQQFVAVLSSCKVSGSHKYKYKP